ncbi:hypothetical protein UF75_2150 [Desulfosporosinus sp. I2]|uniref:MFS transporter n=1 Tax=Desulfosporosinus sp. I2 TaxID=1617025 RepID=UPI00061F4305|nr:hypothetical protein UF75_2150 [Desulfosporosinus sp. I2]
MTKAIMDAGEYDADFINTWTTSSVDQLKTHLEPYTPEWAEKISGVAVRLLSGYFVDKTGKPWSMAIIGYGMLIAVQLLAIADHWHLAVVFVFLERTGKALRSSAKDVMLSHATKQMGTGMGFGIHEAIDPIGGIIGPILFTVALVINNDYKMGYTLMWIPALLTVVVLLTALWKVTEPALLEDCAETQKDKPFRDEQAPQNNWGL